MQEAFVTGTLFLDLAGDITLEEYSLPLFSSCLPPPVSIDLYAPQFCGRLAGPKCQTFGQCMGFLFTLPPSTCPLGSAFVR